MAWLRTAIARFSGGSEAVPPAARMAAQPHWKAQGNAALAAGKVPEAARCYEQGMAAAPQDGALRLNLGHALPDAWEPLLPRVKADLGALAARRG